MVFILGSSLSENSKRQLPTKIAKPSLEEEMRPSMQTANHIGVYPIQNQAHRTCTNPTTQPVQWWEGPLAAPLWRC